MRVPYPIMTIVKSNRFQALRRYAVECCHNPYAMIFITHSAVKITRKTYSTFSCWGRERRRASECAACATCDRLISSYQNEVSFIRVVHREG